jgi:hypothetical protein
MENRPPLSFSYGGDGSGRIQSDADAINETTPGIGGRRNTLEMLGLDASGRGLTGRVATSGVRTRTGDLRIMRPPLNRRKPIQDKEKCQVPGEIGAPLAHDTCLTPPELRAVIDAWPTLPEAIRAGIMAMVRASNPTA